MSSPSPGRPRATTTINNASSSGAGNAHEADEQMTSTKDILKRPQKNNDGDDWNENSLNILRLCRNRAHQKFKVKRRQHIHANLGSYILKEWLSFFPNSKMSAKALQETYTSNFEGVKEPGSSHKKKPRLELPQQDVDDADHTEARLHEEDHLPPSVKIYDDHRDKQWSDLMLTNLLQCGQTAIERQRAGEKSDFATILYDEWKKIYPCSTLTSRNIKSRFTVYQKTKSDLPPPSKRRKIDTASNIPSVSTTASACKIEDPNDDDVIDNGSNGIDDVSTPSGADDNMVCPKHAIHLFHDKDESVECFLTEQLLGIRAQLASQFPGCDIFKPKKPKGFAASVLQEWKRFYPNSEETNKTISFKLAKYDRTPEEEIVGIKVTPKGRTVWSQVMLKHLAEARKSAIEEARKIGSPQSVGRLWKEEWHKMYPEFNGDWKSTVSRYNYHFGNIDSLNPDFDDPEKLLEAMPEDTGNSSIGSANKVSTSFLCDESGFENIKGFRKWTHQMVLDLLTTKAQILSSAQQQSLTLEPGSSEFNKLLLKEFQKLYPKCMESSRSIYSKLQSIEKEEQFRGTRLINSTDEATSRIVVKSEPEDDQVVPVNDVELFLPAARPESVQDEFSEQTNEEEEEEAETIMTSQKDSRTQESIVTLPSDDAEEATTSEVEVAAAAVEVVKTETIEDDHALLRPESSEAQKPPSVSGGTPVKIEATEEEAVEEEKHSIDEVTIEGFEGWTIHMIRDFVACMDLTRKKFSQMKEKAVDGSQIKLVPLLLEGWRELYPETQETVKTFQTRIKHLSQQKEIIKKHLGLLRSKTSEKDEEPFRWNKNMVQDVIDSRKRALVVKEEELQKGRKVSFHALWESEFKKIYPNSTFTSNNLSVHFWTWRKQQQKNGAKNKSKKVGETSEATGAQVLANIKSEPIASHVWNRAEKIRLLEVGKKVEEMMRDQGTPNEVKLAGFANVLLDEWRKANRHRPSLDPKTESARCLNMTYSRVSRDGPGEDDEEVSHNNAWSAASKMLLLKVGQRVEAMLQNSATPNEVKVEGFGNLLQSEWKKQAQHNGSGVESVRSLTMMYSKLQREGLKLEQPNEDEVQDDEPRVIMATWTPKHNRVLQDCMEKFSDLALTAGLTAYKDSVIKSWRAKFTKSSITDAMLWRKITDLSTGEDSQVHSLVRSVKTEAIDFHNEAFKREPFGASSVSSVDSSGPNEGQMVWNIVTIRNLFEAHRKAQEEIVAIPSHQRPQLSNLVHANFIKLHPNCQDVPSILMAKLFSYKSSQSKGLLDLKMTPNDNASSTVVGDTKSIQVVGEEAAGAVLKEETKKKSKSLIFRTWTQAMIDDMMSTRKVAMAKKKKRLEQDHADTLPMTEIWYEEFMKLQPEYKSTKKNLWRKYKWYKSRMGQTTSEKREGGLAASKTKIEDEDLIDNREKVKVEEPTPESVPESGPDLQADSSQPVIRVKSIRKDVFSYIKAVLEETRIFLPAKFVEPVATTLGHPHNNDQFLTPPPLQTFVRPISSFRVSPGQIVNQPQQHLVRPSTQTIPTTLSVMPIMSTAGQMVRPGVTFLTAGTNQIMQGGSSFQPQGVIFGGPVMPIFPNGSPWQQGLPPHQLTIVPVSQSPQSQSTSNANDSIKLPGGATLVAVTDRNADQLLKPKHLEKPHVTITMGDRQDIAGASLKVEPSQLIQQQPALMMAQPPSHQQQPATFTAIMHTPTHQIPLTIPYPINVPSYQPRPSVVQPPPLTQLRPQVPVLLPDTSSHLSLRVRTRLTELNVPESMFPDLIRMYTATRDEFISTLKKGYLAFFPFMLGATWREKYPGVSSIVTGRKLASLMDLYSEDRRKGKISSPEYLTKVPSNFSVTELMLKQLMVCHGETLNNLQNMLNMMPPMPVVYYEMCRRWPKIHPELRMTTKQLISVHHMLSYEPGKDASPEIECQLADIWKSMDKEVPLIQTVETSKEVLKKEDTNEISYDESNVSMDQLQEWFLSTNNISTTARHVFKRPRYFFRGTSWSHEKTEELMLISRLVHRRSLDKRANLAHRLPNQLELLHRTWKRWHPQSPIGKYHLAARCVRGVRQLKRKLSAKENRTINKWLSDCEVHCRNEENTCVVDEVEEEKKRQRKREKEESLAAVKKEVPVTSSLTPPGSGFSGRLTSLSRHANLSVDNWKKDFNKDENVLAYIGAMQKTNSGGKGNQSITWTPEVIRDLMKARTEARRRKRVWEDWAVKKYGGVGIAYNMPNVKFTKVDDMFREEWIKIRPELSSLSIWTLVSYARKFDNLKKQLIEANESKANKESIDKSTTVEPYKPSFAIVFFHNSSIPKYDLEKLSKLKDIPQEVRDLLTSRQIAKERQIDRASKLTLNRLWEESWTELHPGSSKSGVELQRLLFRYEQNSFLRARLAPTLVKETEMTESRSHATPMPQLDEILSIKPRNFVFPENEDEEEISLMSYHTKSGPRGTSRKYYSTLERDILRPNHHTFEIPLVQASPIVRDEKVSKLRWSAKGYNLVDKITLGTPELTFSHDEGKYWCTQCNLFYDNVNNYVYHQRLHKLPDPKDIDTVTMTSTE